MLYATREKIFLAIGFDFMGVCHGQPIRAFLSRAVPPTDLGKVFAMLSSIESLVPIIASQLYSWVYLETINTSLPGATYFMSAGICALSAVLCS